jgi:hypothetical protein
MATKDICPERRDMDALCRVVDFIIPADDFPSAGEAGVPTNDHGVLKRLRPGCLTTGWNSRGSGCNSAILMLRSRCC